VNKPYHIVTRAAKDSAAIIEQFCQTNGQILLPIVNLIESASQVVETVIHEIGIQTLETILTLSAEQVAGPQTPGKASGDIRWHGSQPGHVKLADRKVRLQRPRLRHKTDGEVKVPAYEALRSDRGMSQRMLGALLRGVSTRDYKTVLPEMAATAGVSRSSVSRQAIEASSEQLSQLQERRWEGIEILVIYIDGQRFASHHILSAVGVDIEGKKHVLGIEPGATENAAAVKRLLTAQGPRVGDRSQVPVRDRRRQGAASGHRRSVRSRAGGPALQKSQASQCHRRITERPARANAKPDASRLEGAHRRGG
jgi:hypothetical protein